MSREACGVPRQDMAAKLKKEIGENKQRMTELAGQKSSLIAQLQVTSPSAPLYNVNLCIRSQ
jgi:phage shock protein A